MTLVRIKTRNTDGKAQRIALYEALGIAPGGPSPRGSTFYKTFQNCPREFYIKYVLGWRLEVPSDALTVGLLWHYVLEQYYSTIMQHQLTSKKARPNDRAWLWGGCNEGAALGFAAIDKVTVVAGYVEIASVVRRMFDCYLEVFDRRDRLRIFAVEETLQFEDTDYADAYSCRADMIVEDYDRGGLWFWEHKSARALTDDLLSAYDMDLQILGEWWLINTVLDTKEYPPLRGVIVNIATKPTSTNPENGQVKLHRHPVCPSEGHVRAFERTIGTRKRMLAVAAECGWPQWFGNCAGASRGYSKCECFELCQQHPDFDAAGLAKAGVDRFPGYVLSEGTVRYDER